MTRNLARAVGEELDVLADPLRMVVLDREPPHHLVRLLAATGWRLPGLASVDLDGLFNALEEVTDAVADLPAALRTDSLADMAAAFDTVATTIQSVRGLTDPFQDLLAAVLGGSTSLAADLVEDLWQYLVITWLGRRRPVLLRVLRSVDLVTWHETTRLATGNDVEVRRVTKVLRVEPGGILALLDDPVGTLRNLYVPEQVSDAIDAQVMALAIGAGLRPVVTGLGGDLRVFAPWGILPELSTAEQDAAARTVSVDLPVPSPEASPWLPRLELVAEFLSAADTGVLGRTGPAVELSVQGVAGLEATRGTLDVDLDLAGLAGTVYLSSDEIVAQSGGIVTPSAVVTSTAASVVLGADQGTRLELGQPRLRAELVGDDPPDVEVELATIGARLVVSVGDGDSFLAGILPDIEIDVEADLGLVWSRLGGLRLTGSPDLVARVAVDRTLLGLLTLEAVESSVVLGSDELVLVLVVDGAFTLGPFTARVEGVGLRILVTVAGSGNLGIADLAVEFQPPYGFEFEILVGETVIGGGFVRHDPATGRYWGALGLEFLCIELGAIAVVDTRLPGDPDGWALFASLFLTFPSVPLGFGFFLSGVGGIVCLNRTMDSLAIAAGLREGAVDMILFPDDPVNDAEEIIAELDAWFPLAAGATVFGLAATITWGTPTTIITGQLGVMLALPDIQIAVIGSIELVLPADKPVLQIHLDTLGSYVAAEQTLLIMASLYDSTLLGIDLSGDMAMYSRFGSNPYFLLSVGGYHPDFKPPVGLPSVIRDLRRIRAEVAISDDVWYALETYVAVTSNTFQFGALASFEASTRFLGATYTASGHIGFDVLLHFSPFSFVASFSAGVSVTSGDNDREIVAAELEARLEGPEPWYATGYGRFSFLGIRVRFEVAVGGPAGIEVRVRHNVLDAVVAALEALSAWGEADAGPSPVTMAEGPAVETDDTDTPPAEVLRLRPDADIRVSQTVAPLNRRMDIYGLYDIDGPNELQVTGAGIIGLSTTSSGEVVDWFAPAQYDDLTRAEKLSAPSYEQMDAGVTISAGGVSMGTGSRTISATYEVVVVNGLEVSTAVGRRPPFGGRQTLDAGMVMDSARRFGSTRTASLPDTFAFREPTWSLADAQSGRPVGPPSRYSTTLARARRRTGVVAVPSHAARQTTAAPS